MFIRWTGACHWSTGMEHWSGALEWSAGVEYWSGLLEWPVAFACLIFYMELIIKICMCKQTEQ